MFERVLGVYGKYGYCFSILMFVLGANVAYVSLMAMFLEPMLQGFGVQTESYSYQDHFREYHIMLSIVAGAFLLFKDMKLLSYTAVAKVAVMCFLIMLAFGFGFNETKRRTDQFNHHKDPTFGNRSRFPLTPSIFGMMKALSAWEAAFGFHMGVSDMYSSLRNPSKNRWKFISTTSCSILVVFNLIFGFVGMWATIHMGIEPTNDVADTCRYGGVFINLYQSHPLMNISKMLLFIVLVLSYPMLCFFLKSFVITLIKSLFPNLVRPQVKNLKTVDEETDHESDVHSYENRTESVSVSTIGTEIETPSQSEILTDNETILNAGGGISESKLNIIVTISVWCVVTGASLITENIFDVVDFSCAIFGSFVIYIFPAIAWIQSHGGYKYILTLGLCKPDNKQIEITSSVVNADAESASQADTMKKEILRVEGTKYKTSMFMANIVLISAIICACCGIISVTRSIQHRISGDTNPDFPWRMNY